VGKCYDWTDLADEAVTLVLELRDDYGKLAFRAMKLLHWSQQDLGGSQMPELEAIDY
jgi:uncharacterized protein YgfB (UPF0149 family)